MNKTDAQELESLAYLVRQMRDAQRKYYIERTQQALSESKRLERIVDMELNRLKFPGTPVQQSIFH